jgi:RNA polymerase sigma-70 factor, ECF subfamily
MTRDDGTAPSSVADMAALGKMLEKHQKRLLEMLRRRLDPTLAHRRDAEDIMSDVFLVALRKWKDFQSHSNMAEYPWLYRIALDCLIAAWRKETRDCRDLVREMPWPEHSSMQLGLSLVSPSTGPRTAAERQEMDNRIRQVLDLLKPKDREILRMRHDDQLSFAEAAAILDITENAANVRYVRAIERLRTIWQQFHPDEAGP